MEFRAASLDVNKPAELKAWIIEVAARNRLFLEFLDDGLEAGKRKDSGYRPHV